MRGGAVAASNRFCQAGAQGHWVGRCRVRRLAEVATRAGTLISWVRRVAQRALACRLDARTPAVRARLNAITACANQAALAYYGVSGGLSPDPPALIPE